MGERRVSQRRVCACARARAFRLIHSYYNNLCVRFLLFKGELERLFSNESDSVLLQIIVHVNGKQTHCACVSV